METVLRITEGYLVTSGQALVADPENAREPVAFVTALLGLRDRMDR
jgi:hypothetical protein